MCDPVSIGIATATVSAASAYLGFQGMQNTAKSQRDAAGINYGQEYNALGEKQSQVGAQQSENTVDALIAKVKAQGRISASASDSGLSEATAGAQENAVSFTVGREASINNLNSEAQRNQIGSELTGARIARDSKIIANQAPSNLELVLGLGKAGLQGVGAYNNANNKGKK